jgi:MFS family permease
LALKIVAISANQEVMINKYRPYAMGINQTMGSSAAILGTFVAAGFVKHNAGGRGGWQWAYYF